MQLSKSSGIQISSFPKIKGKVYHEFINIQNIALISTIISIHIYIHILYEGIHIKVLISYSTLFNSIGSPSDSIKKSFSNRHNLH